MLAPAAGPAPWQPRDRAAPGQRLSESEHSDPERLARPLLWRDRRPGTAGRRTRELHEAAEPAASSAGPSTRAGPGAPLDPPARRRHESSGPSPQSAYRRLTGRDDGYPAVVHAPAHGPQNLSNGISDADMATRRINSDVLCLSILRRERKLLLTNERSSLWLGCRLHNGRYTQTVESQLSNAWIPCRRLSCGFERTSPSHRASCDRCAQAPKPPHKLAAATVS